MTKTIAKQDGFRLSEKAKALALTARELEEDGALGRLMDQSLKDSRHAVSPAVMKKELKLR